MSAPNRPPIDYAPYIRNARKLRAQALGAALADFRQWLLAPFRRGRPMRAASIR
jgi:hypothetical protein